MDTHYSVDQPFRFVQAVAHANLGARAAPLKALMFVLASMADESLGTHGASIPELSRLSGCSECTTRELVRKALASGYISIIREGKGQTTRVYQLNINRLESLCESEGGKDSRRADAFSITSMPTVQPSTIQTSAIQTSDVQTSAIQGSGGRAPDVRLPAVGSERSPNHEALPHQRSTQTNPNPSAPERSVFDDVSAGARALLGCKRAAWRRRKMLEMLQPAFVSWNTAGITTCPVEKAVEIADLPAATPARVQFLLEDIAAKIARPRPGGSESNPVALLIWGLGDSQKSKGRPRDVPRSYTDRWAAEESQAVGLMNAQGRMSSNVERASAQLAELRTRAGERTLPTGSRGRPALDLSRLSNQAFGVPTHLDNKAGGDGRSGSWGS